MPSEFEPRVYIDPVKEWSTKYKTFADLVDDIERGIIIVLLVHAIGECIDIKWPTPTTTKE